MTEQRLTRRQAAILTCYTGITFELHGISAAQELAEELMGRPIWTPEFSDSELLAQLKEKVKPLLGEIAYIPEVSPENEEPWAEEGDSDG